MKNLTGWWWNNRGLDKANAQWIDCSCHFEWIYIWWTCYSDQVPPPAGSLWQHFLHILWCTQLGKVWTLQRHCADESQNPCHKCSPFYCYRITVSSDLFCVEGTGKILIWSKVHTLVIIGFRFVNLFQKRRNTYIIISFCHSFSIFQNCLLFKTD